MLVKYWLSVSDEEQERASRRGCRTAQALEFSPTDLRARALDRWPRRRTALSVDRTEQPVVVVETDD